jgi:signal peptidase I
MTDISAPHAASYAPRVSIPRPTLRRPGLLRELLNGIFFIAAALVLSELALPRSSIDGPSMQPTMFTGQHLLISRLHYLIADPQRGDIAVFDNPNDGNNDMLIKRVLGVPGDTVELREEPVMQADGQEEIDSVLYVNGQRVEEPYFVNRPCRKDCSGTWTLGPDEYFFVGDNRNHSNDSRDTRSVGPIPRENIVGKAIWRHWPPENFGPIY